MFSSALITLELGLRRGELLGLFGSDYEYSNRTLTISPSQGKNGIIRYGETKTEKFHRTLLLSEDLNNILNVYVRSNINLPLIYRSDGSNFTPAVLNNKFSDLLLKNDLPHIRFHDLRHTNATLLLNADIPAKIVSERLGHSNISTTLDIYTHVNLKSQSKSAIAISNILLVHDFKTK